jgi:hypothetical protein
LILIIIFAKINKNNMIPSGTRFIGFSDSVNLTEKRSASVNAETAVYTVDELRGYKVYTALLTQSGKGAPLTTSRGELTVGVTYKLGTIEGKDDFTNVGAPTNESGISFVATGTIPANWESETILDYNTGAPVVTVLENTIGNIWFNYYKGGIYGINSDGLFTEKTFMEVLNVTDINNNDSGNAFIGVGLLENDSQLTIQSVALTEGDMYNTPIEIRVYN